MICKSKCLAIVDPCSSCLGNYQPVCATDLKVYRNSCEMTCKNNKLVVYYDCSYKISLMDC